MHLDTLGHGFDWSADHLEWPVSTDVGPGLAGVIAGSTHVMWLDPSSGRLAYRGIPIDALATEPDFERVAHLLITGATADRAPSGFSEFRSNLRGSRALPGDVLDLVADLAESAHPTRALRAGVSALGCHELDVDDDLGGERHWRELRIVGQVSALANGIIRLRRSRAPGTPAETESLSEATLEALTGRSPSDEERRILDLLWVLYAAHGLDAPTFASMVIASCLADPYYTIVGGLSALRGPRQGGAGERVVQALLDIEEPAAAAGWVRDVIGGGGIIPGFGHTSYRMPDPRVVVLRRAAATMAARAGRAQLFETARAVEEEATRRLAARGVFVNINLYGALLFHLLGAQPAEVPCLISVARVAGIVALVRECLETVRLYRPLSRYVGRPERKIAGGELE